MDATSAIAAIALGWAIFEFRLGRIQARTSFEDELVREYRSTIKPELAQFMIRAPSEDEIPSLLPAVWRYVDLSNEQVFLRSQGRVGKSTWIDWADGIQSTLERGGIRENWIQLQEAAPRDFTELRLFCADGGDPRRWTPRWRRLLRLRALTGEEALRGRRKAQHAKR